MRHLQTDGQIERLNQILEQYLQYYINYDQDNWVRYLLIAQFTYNSAPQEFTKVSLFKANFGREPAWRKQPKEGPLTGKAILTAQELLNLHDEIRQQLKFVRGRMVKHYNQERLKGLTFKEGEIVYLL